MSDAEQTASVKVALAGFGWFGKIHLEQWRGIAGVEIVGIYDPDTGAGDRVSAQDRFHAGTDGETLQHSAAGGAEPYRFESYEELLASDADLVDIVVPEVLHAGLARQALRADKNVLVEKPLALSEAEVAELRELADNRGRHVYVGHVLRFDLRHRALREHIDPTELRHLSFQRNYQVEAHDVYGRVHPVYGAAVHDIDLAVWLVGRRPESVRAFSSHYLEREYPDVLDIIVDWGGGLRAVIQNSWHLQSNPFGYDFECKVQTTRTTASIRNEPDLWIWDAAKAEAPDLHLWPKVAGERSGALKRELEHFARCARAGIPSDEVPLSDVQDVAAIADAVLNSLAQGSAEIRLGVG